MERCPAASIIPKVVRNGLSAGVRLSAFALRARLSSATPAACNQDLRIHSRIRASLSQFPRPPRSDLSDQRLAKKLATESAGEGATVGWCVVLLLSVRMKRARHGVVGVASFDSRDLHVCTRVSRPPSCDGDARRRRCVHTGGHSRERPPRSLTSFHLIPSAWSGTPVAPLARLSGSISPPVPAFASLGLALSTLTPVSCGVCRHRGRSSVHRASHWPGTRQRQCRSRRRCGRGCDRPTRAPG
jgi:hypothetical protein